MRATQLGQSFLLLLDIVEILNAQNIDYAVIGAVAASVHGAVRASLDADALLSLTTASLPALEVKLKKSGLKTELRRGAPDDPIAAVLAVQDSYENRVDLLVGIRGLDAGAFERALTVPFGSERVRVIGLEDFVAMKIFAGSSQDLNDARRVIGVVGKGLNRPLLQTLTQRYGKKYLAELKRLST
jgi:hypothetical protein